MIFQYFIQNLGLDGLATVEYFNDKFGRIIKTFYLPIHKSPEYIEKYIIKNTPRKEFLARELKEANIDFSSIKFEGSYETSLEDDWYEERISPRIKRELLKFPEFLVWIFKMNKGDYKFFKHDELTRNLELPENLNLIENNQPVHPIYPIGIFVSGSFLLQRPNKNDFFVCGSKQPTFEYIDYVNGSKISLLALEDDSEYHCLTPRSKEPVFWNRLVETITPGTLDFISIKEMYVYLAKGHIEFNGQEYRDRSIIKIEKNGEWQNLIIKKTSIIAKVWKE